MKQKTHLQLLQRETTSHAGLHVVLLRGAVHDGTQESASGARSDGSGLLLAEQSAASLLSSLIEPGLHTLIPILLEVGIRQNVVVLHLLGKREKPKSRRAKKEYLQTLINPRTIVGLKNKNGVQWSAIDKLTRRGYSGDLAHSFLICDVLSFAFHLPGCVEHRALTRFSKGPLLVLSLTNRFGREAVCNRIDDLSNEQQGELLVVGN